MLGTATSRLDGGFEVDGLLSCPYHHQRSCEFAKLWDSGRTNELEDNHALKAAKVLSQTSDNFVAVLSRDAIQRTTIEPSKHTDMSLEQIAMILSITSGQDLGNLSRKERIFWWMGREDTRKPSEDTWKRLLELREQCSCFTMHDAYPPRLSSRLHWGNGSVDRASQLGYLQAWARRVASNHRLFKSSYERSWFITDSGLAGIGPHDLATGDRIFFLHGSQFAFALRANGDAYRLIGAVYVEALETGPRTAYGYAVVDKGNGDDPLHQENLQAVIDATLETVIIR